jgi:hypothetical protein
VRSRPGDLREAAPGDDDGVGVDVALGLSVRCGVPLPSASQSGRCVLDSWNRI